MKRYLVFLIALMLLLSVFSGCTKTQDTDTGETQGETQVDDSEDTSSDKPDEEVVEADDFSETGVLYLDWFASGGTDSVIESPWKSFMVPQATFLYSTLVKVDNSSNMTPDLAKTWDISDDGLTYTFHLVENAMWHDGQPLTADDVAFSLNTIILVPDSSAGGKLSMIEGYQDAVDGVTDGMSGVIVEDDYTITIKLSTPNSLLGVYISLINIMPEHLLGDIDPVEITDYEPFYSMPIGSGPYMVTEVSYPDYFIAERYDGYYGDAAGIKTVIFTSHTTGGSEAFAADMISGKADLGFGNALNDINLAKNIQENNPDIEIVIAPSNYQRQFFFNCAGPGDPDAQFNESILIPEVRQAFGLIVDKAAIAALYPDQATPLSSFINPQSPAYNTDIPLWERDVETGKQMLDAAGFDYDTPIRITYYYDDQVTKDIMDVITQNFADAGVTVETFLAADGGSYEELYQKRAYEIGYFGNCGNVDPILDFSALTQGDTNTEITGQDTETVALVTQLTQQYLASTDIAEKKEIIDQLQIETNKTSYIVPLYCLNRVRMYNAAKLSLDEDVLRNALSLNSIDWNLSTWALLKE